MENFIEKYAYMNHVNQNKITSNYIKQKSNMSSFAQKYSLNNEKKLSLNSDRSIE